MHRDTDRPGLIRDRPGDGLTDPPGRIGRKFIALTVIELLHGLDQTQIAFLDQIQKEHSTAHIPLCDTDNKTQIGLRQTLLRILVAHLHLLGQLNLFLRIQKRHLTDLFQVHPHRIFDADAVRHGQIDILYVNFVLLT